jgi:arsenate reductase
VLFVCSHNAGRSQIAAGWLRSIAGDTVVASSAGAVPTSAIPAKVIDAMAEVDVDISEEFPKPLTDEIVRAADVVVTLGCGDVCAVLPGQRYEDWQLDDPADRDLAGVRLIRDDIRTRVEALAASLGTVV